MAKKEKQKAADTLGVLKYFFHNVRAVHSASTEHLMNEHHRHYYKRLLKYMETAKLFELDVEQLTERADNLKKQVTGASSDRLFDLEVADAYINNFDLFNLPLPAKHMYIGFNHPSVFGGSNAVMQADIASASLTGVFISKDIITIFSEFINNTGGVRYDAAVLYCDGAWTPVSHQGNPTVIRLHHVALVSSIIDTINEHTAVTIDHTTDKTYTFKTNLWNKKKLVKTPQAFYRVNIKKSTPIGTGASAPIDDERTRHEKAFAYYVLGHNKYRVKTGRNPIDPIVEQQLLKNPDRQMFYDSTQLDEKARAVLAKRNITVGVNDWVAILEYRVEGHVANSKGGRNPYIPAIHTNV